MKNTLIFLSILLTSCGFHSGMMTGNAAITADSEIIGTAFGTASATLVLGIGGLNSRSLVYDAKKELYYGFPLKQGQAYANVSVDFHRVNLFLVVLNRVTINADIVQLDVNKTDGGLQRRFLNDFLFFSSDSSEASSINGIRKGDILLYYNNGKITNETIVGAMNSENFYSMRGSIIKRLEIANLFSSHPDQKFDGNPYKVNDFIVFDLQGPDKSIRPTAASIIGINPSSVLVTYQKRYKVLKLDEVRMVE